MSLPQIDHCPGTLATGFDTYSRKCLSQMFDGKKVSHILTYESPASNLETDELFEENRKNMSISGVQEKLSVILDKNKLRLTENEECGSYILKPIPNSARRPDQMPANEHLTMQIASQVYNIETAGNALIFFADGKPAYLTRRFDVYPDGNKKAQDDFASLAGRTPQTHGKNYKYLGNYLEIFELLKQYVPAYAVEAPKLLKLIMFNYLFSNGDAHFKNFSLLETDDGDYKLSPAYDLLNSRIHIKDSDFALEQGLLPPQLAQGKLMKQFSVLAEQALIKNKIFDGIVGSIMGNQDLVEELVFSSFLDEKTRRNYFQAYQNRYNQLLKVN